MSAPGGTAAGSEGLSGAVIPKALGLLVGISVEESGGKRKEMTREKVQDKEGKKGLAGAV